MRYGEWSKLVSVAGRILLAFLFVLPQSAWAGQDPKARDNPKLALEAVVQQTGEKTSSTAAPATTAQSQKAKGETPESAVAEEKPSGDGKHEGIKVHGHWTIEVRNPDGTLVTHREFENALVANSGPAVMAAILACFTAGNCPSRTNVLVWRVQLDGSPQPCTQQDPVTGAIVAAPCFLDGPLQGYPLSATLQGTSFVLSGAITAGANGSLTKVSTLLPGGGPLTGSFTSRMLDGLNGDPQGPVSVSTGQTIAVTVYISFS